MNFASDHYFDLGGYFSVIRGFALKKSLQWDFFKSNAAN